MREPKPQGFVFPGENAHTNGPPRDIDGCTSGLDHVVWRLSSEAPQQGWADPMFEMVGRRITRQHVHASAVLHHEGIIAVNRQLHQCYRWHIILEFDLHNDQKIWSHEPARNAMEMYSRREVFLDTENGAVA
jgi:hypothetical protein